MATPNSDAVSLKLLIDTKHQRVLFAEDGMVGSFGKLYASVENLSNTYMQPDVNKAILLKPKVSVAVAGSKILGLLDNVESPAKNVFFMCSTDCSSPVPSPTLFGSTCVPTPASSHRYVTEDPSERWPQCNSSMTCQATYVGERPETDELSTCGAGAAGYVKGVVTYMIMDDLEVKPMSTISSITLLNRFNVKDVGALEEMVVQLGMNEAVKLLKESLQSTTVLTNVFLGKKPAI